MTAFRTRVAMTYEESSPGVPLWGANTVTTDLLPGQTEIAIENLVAGKRYYIKTWNEDQFGNKSKELIKTFNTPLPTRIQPLSFSSNGYLDSGSPLYAYLNIPIEVQSVDSAIIKLAFRQFMAPATAAAASGTLTSDSGGGSTSGSSSASSSSSDLPGTLGFVSDSVTTHSHGGGAAAKGYATVLTQVTGSGNHSHSIPHTHTTPNHDHSVPTHTHALTYGTYEETYPTSHSVIVTTYLRSGGAWVLQDTSAAITDDIADLDLTSVITGPGDWRIQVKSEAGQPNGGRLGLDIFGTLTVVI